VGAGLANDHDPCLDVRFDFHLFTSPFRFRLLPGDRRRILSFEAGNHRHSPIQARTRRKIDHETGAFLFVRWRRMRLKVEAEGVAVTTPSASTQIANVSLMDSRQDGFFKWVARIADEHPEHGEVRGVSGEDRVVHDQQRLGSAWVVGHLMNVSPFVLKGFSYA